MKQENLIVFTNSCVILCRTRSEDLSNFLMHFLNIKGDVFKKVCGVTGVIGHWPVYYIINGLKSKNRKFLEIAKSEDSENTTHVDFG